METIQSVLQRAQIQPEENTLPIQTPTPTPEAVTQPIDQAPSPTPESLVDEQQDIPTEQTTEPTPTQEVTIAP